MNGIEHNGLFTKFSWGLPDRLKVTKTFQNVHHNIPGSFGQIFFKKTGQYPLENLTGMIEELIRPWFGFRVKRTKKG